MTLPFHWFGDGRQPYQVKKSLRFRKANSNYLARVMGAPTSQNIWTFSVWVKRGELSGAQDILGLGTGNFQIYFGTGGEFNFFNGAGAVFATTAVYRDPTAWMHILLSVNPGASGVNKVRLFINGTEITAYAVDNRAAFASSSYNSSGITHVVGSTAGIINVFDGEMADLHFIDGQQKVASDFGQFDVQTGVWMPIAYAGTYGANGHRLDFTDNSAATAAAIGADRSGNGNNFTPANVSITAGVTNDSLVDSPTMYGADNGLGGEARGNYATFNFLDKGAVVLSNACQSLSNASTWASARSTIAVDEGKYYAEVRIDTAGGTMAGIVGLTASLASYPGIDVQGYGYLDTTGNYYHSAVNTALGATLAGGDYLGIALDATAGTVQWYKNGVAQGGAITLTGVTKPYFFAVGSNTPGASSINFGQKAFNNAAPAGFKALCTQNLPVPVIQKPSQYFNVVTYTANGGVQAVTGAGHQPDMLYSKARAIASQHYWMDSVRGPANLLTSDSAGQENAAATFVTSFDPDGFSHGTGNYAAAAPVSAWLWKKAAIAGMDLLLFTGNGVNRAIAHTLGAIPAFLIAKARGPVNRSWLLYHQILGASNYLIFDSPNATAVNAGVWNTAPTSSNVNVGTVAGTNASGDNMEIIAFAEVPGFSKQGGYVGNANADGTFVYCGFRPRAILLKRFDASEAWLAIDAVRDPQNPVGTYFTPNTAAAEASTPLIDFVANGFKMRVNGATNVGNYVFAAFAEAPFKYSRAR